MIPIGDSPRDPNHRPFATWVLIGTLVVVGALTLPQGLLPASPAALLEVPLDEGPWTVLDVIVHQYGFRPVTPSLTTAVTAMFLHADVVHLLGNLLYLWIYGPNVERRLGAFPFLLLYATAGVLAAALYSLVSLASPIPMIGASGAISGLLGAYLVFFPSNWIRIFVYVGTIRLPAWLVLLAFLVVDNILPLVTGSAVGVAHAAHIGGFFGGLVLAIGVRLLHPDPGHAQRAPAGGRRLARALELRDAGMLLDAHRLLTELATSPGAQAAAAREQLVALEAEPGFERVAGRR